MSTQNQTIVGGRQLDDLLKTLPAKMEKNIMRSALRSGAAVMLQEVQQRIPVDSGQLRASARITTRGKAGAVSASVKVGNFVAWYAHLVEFGTKPHYISVSDEDRGAGRGIGRRGTANRRETLASISTVNRRVLQIGSNFVGPSVYHPGTTARPFMRPAAEAGFTPSVQAVQKKVRERLNKQGLNTPDTTPAGPEE